MPWRIGNYYLMLMGRAFPSCKKGKDGGNSHTVTRIHLISLSCTLNTANFMVDVLTLRDEEQKNTTELIKQVTLHEDQEKKKGILVGNMYRKSQCNQEGVGLLHLTYSFHVMVTGLG